MVFEMCVVELVMFGLVLLGEDFHPSASPSVVEDFGEGVCKKNYYLQLTMFNKITLKPTPRTEKHINLVISYFYLNTI